MPVGAATIQEGIAHHRAGRWEQAEAVYREILLRQPDNADALHLLGLVAFRTSRHAEALDLLKRASDLKPNVAGFHSDLAMALAAMGRLEQSMRACQKAAQLQPNSPKILSNLGNALQLAGHVDEAMETYQHSLALDPSDLTTRNNLGEAFKRKAMWDHAITLFREILHERPEMFEAQLNLGGALQARGDLDDAIASFERAGQLRPGAPEVQINLSAAYKDAGLLDRAIQSADRAIELDNTAHTASARLFLLHYHPNYDARRIRDEHRQWYERYVKPSARPNHVHFNQLSPDRRLRIGYVSPDFRDHPVTYNMLPLLAAHDHQQFEVFCYSNTFDQDELTERVKVHTDNWRDITGLDDQQTTDLIAADQIDILVDLALHTGNNRLLVFARKPAPIQVTFAGYPGTTGLPTIGYRLTDPHIDPTPDCDQYYVERSYRLPDTFWCFDPSANEPQVNALPALANGYITFGCLSNFCKINDEVLKLWAEVLKRVAGSRLLMLCKRGQHRQRHIDFLASMGIDRDRIQFVDQQARAEYLRIYHQIDIGLDTFPYNGHTTSLDSFWMGVPVITLVGQTVVGRAGLSQSRNLKLEELIAHSPQEFVQTAVTLSEKLDHLSTLRATLRERLTASCLMDGKRFAAGIETAYRWMWTQYLSRGSNTIPNGNAGSTGQ